MTDDKYHQAKALPLSTLTTVVKYKKLHQDPVISKKFVDIKWITANLSTTKHQLKILLGCCNNNNKIKQQQVVVAAGKHK